jgi:hypothetical protein
LSRISDELERGGWQRDDGWTMPAYRRAAGGSVQLLSLSPNRSTWFLFVDQVSTFHHKNILSVMKQADRRRQG